MSSLHDQVFGIQIQDPCDLVYDADGFGPVDHIPHGFSGSGRVEQLPHRLITEPGSGHLGPDFLSVYLHVDYPIPLFSGCQGHFTLFS